MLCAPLTNQGKLSGIIYLENNLATGAFTADRLEVLQLLSGQAAIALENALLHQQQEEYARTLEQRVKERTAQLQREVVERQKAEEAAQAANRAKSAFLANMSHELRTPLNAILGFSQLMQNDRNLTPDQSENLGIVRRSGKHLLTLINQVLDLSKIEAGHMPLLENEFDLNQMLEDIKGMFSLKAREKGLWLHLDLAAEIQQFIKTDEVKLRQVLINLTGNALKFTKQGGIKIQVRQEAVNSEQLQLSFAVIDTGVGIPPEEIDKLFQAFSQTSSGEKSREGTGLGLYISQQFVKLMGGQMQVASQVGTGTTFSFHLPVKLSQQTQNVSQALQVAHLAPGQPTYRILVADDNHDNRQLLVKLLSSKGFVCETASDGQQVLQQCQRQKSDLIFMDLRMPKLDGYATTKAIRKYERANQVEVPTKIILLSASAFQEEEQQRDCGYNDFVTKPFLEEEIWRVLALHLGVEYEYEQQSGLTAINNGGEIADMTVLGSAWLAEFERGVLEGNLESLQRMVKELTFGDLQEQLSILVNQFEFERLVNLIQAAQQKLG